MSADIQTVYERIHNSCSSSPNDRMMASRMCALLTNMATIIRALLLRGSQSTQHRISVNLFISPLASDKTNVAICVLTANDEPVAL